MNVISDKMVYLDHAATTGVDPRVLDVMLPFWKERYGNPSSLYRLGRDAAKAVNGARETIASILAANPREIIFTSCGSESDNLALRGVLLARQAAGKGNHIITTPIEHHAVGHTASQLASKSGFELTVVPVDKYGLVDPQAVADAIRDDTALISIMYANNEVGSIQPIKKIGKIIAEINKKEEHPIYFHTDAVQAANWLELNVADLGIHLLTLSGHKIYGPKGVGILYVKEGTPIMPLIYGGDQEWKLRAGTENTAGIVGMGAAISQIRHSKVNTLEMLKLKDKLIKGVLTNVRGSKLNGPKKAEDQLPNIANFSFLGVEGESLVISLDQEGFAVSTGSACTSTALLPSHVLIAMGLIELDAHSSLRISLGKYTTIAEIDQFIKILPKVIEKLRKISGR